MMTKTTFAVWRRADCLILQVTRFLLFLLGLVFIVAVSTEVFSRLFLETSLFFVHSLTLFLLVWFFLLGAGPALREGAHVGFDLLVTRLPPALGRATILFSQIAVLTFFVLMIWSGYRTLASASQQVDSALGVSTFWVMLAFPIGFGLLFYHQVSAMVLGSEKASS